VHGAQISQGSAPRVRCRKGTTTHPPTARLGLQSVLLQFNQRSYRRGVEYMRGAGSVHTQRPQARAVAQAAGGGRLENLCKRWRTEQTEQTFPKGSGALNFGYHVRAELSTCPTNRSSRGSSFSAAFATSIGLPRRDARIDITTILHNAPQLHYSIHPTHTIRSSPSRGPSARRPLPKSSRTALVLKCSKGICKKSLLPKIPFQRIPKPRPIANYYSTPSRDEW